MNYKYYCSSCSNNMVPKDSARGNHFSRSSSLLPPPKGRVTRKASRRRWPRWVWKDSAFTWLQVGGGQLALKRLSCRVIMSLLAAPGEQEWKAFKTVTCGKQIHIFDKRPDDWPLAAHQIWVGSTTRSKPGGWGCSLGRGAPTVHQVLRPCASRWGESSKGEDTYNMISSPSPGNSSSSGRESLTMSDLSMWSQIRGSGQLNKWDKTCVWSISPIHWCIKNYPKFNNLKHTINTFLFVCF